MHMANTLVTATLVNVYFSKRNLKSSLGNWVNTVGPRLPRP